jgi:hypothetical protein
MKLDKAMKRDRKRNKRNEMQVDSKSVFVIQNTQKERAKKIKQQRKIKEEMKEI